MDFIKKHGLAVVLILIALFVYFSPALKGKVIVQSDIVQSLATSKETRDYRAETGIEPLWTNSQFSGMPTYQMNTEYPNNLMNYFEMIKRVFPTNLGLIFVIALGCYIMLSSMKVDYRLALLGCIVVAFSTFFILSLEAGHNSKLRAIGYMAPVVASIITAFNGKRLLGFALASLTLALSFNSNHPQITYYTLLISGKMLTRPRLESVPSTARLRRSSSWAKVVSPGGINFTPARAPSRWRPTAIETGSSDSSASRRSSVPLPQEMAWAIPS